MTKAAFGSAPPWKKVVISLIAWVVGGAAARNILPAAFHWSFAVSYLVGVLIAAAAAWACTTLLQVSLWPTRQS